MLIFSQYSSPSLFDTSLSKPEASSLAHQSIPSDDFSRASAYFPDHSTTHDNGVFNTKTAFYNVFTKHYVNNN